MLSEKDIFLSTWKVCISMYIWKIIFYQVLLSLQAICSSERDLQNEHTHEDGICDERRILYILLSFQHKALWLFRPEYFFLSHSQSLSQASWC